MVASIDTAVWPELTLPQMLREQARRQPGAIAIRQKDFGIWKPLTWSDYWRRACRVGLGLRALGLGVGGRVAIVSENRVEWLLTQLGAGTVGGVAVGVYSTSPAEEMGYVLEHADVELVVCEDQEQTDKVLQVADRLPLLRRIVMMETKGLRSYAPAERERIVTYAEVEADGARREASELATLNAVLDSQRLDDTGLMIYTSGSTGKPKGAMLSYRNMRGVAPGIADRLSMDARTVHLSYLPLCHVAEQMLSTFVPLYLGSQVNFGESIRTVQEDLREVAPTIFLGVPRIWEKLHASISIKMQEAGRVQRWLYQRALARCAPFLEKSPAQYSAGERLTHALWYWLVLRALQNFIGLRRVRVAMTGAAPIPPDVVRYFRNLGVPLLEVYGLTESAGMIFGQHPDRVKVGTVGEPILGVEWKMGEAGELLVRGDMVFQGYYKNAQATADTVRDGWLHTGDVVAEQDGRVRIVDRLKDIMITAGGKNLTPSEIENAVKGSPYVKECIVIADGRRFVSALIQLEFDTVGKWAESRRIAFTHFRSLAESAQVRELVQQEVSRANAGLAPVAQIKRFHLLTKELDHDDGEVTATMKVRRASIYRTYAAEIEKLYVEETMA
ncbi:Long-chain-fatty-acid--CoA ligase FadD15 [Achromobacter piechaudii]|uniref:Long-chain-fatty-acid--CoA ligase FadD15 n=2 Tax=Achromobacter piechaudii TaxID=72556 RepID=A0ABM8KWN0_9BURK|nr:Long-chain-fatty-acid--CoA ligase FadD15 [Achromobacter piechaudii]CAB3856976.1 Long-chain-fatty-acid--CoA ligase FadD15 [Achromobacter piechaudii]CAB3950122.1 Long-chain-fatty-acid--CoA ligase FadD15 [Achromobacter piechaudii]